MASGNNLRSEVPPQRIALCITELDFGGAERFLVELATRLDRTLFAPSVFCLGPRPVGPGESLVARLEGAHVPVCFFNARGLTDAWRVFGRLHGELSRQRPALLQTFLWHANVLGPMAARRLTANESSTARLPVVTGLRVAEPRRRWRWPLERWAGRFAARHVAVSEGVARTARERVGLAAEKIVVIPNGVDAQHYPAPPIDPRHLGIQSGKRFLLFVGRLDRDDQKGAASFLRHAGALLQSLADHDLVFVGDGPRLDSLRRRTGELGLQQRIHWLGWRDDLPSIVAAADLLVAPSQWEGMSNSVLEAMASRKPIVAFDSAGTRELLGDRSSQKAARAQVVAADDWRGLVDRVETTARDAELAKWLGAANRARVQSEFCLSRKIDEYGQLYLALIEGSRRRNQVN